MLALFFDKIFILNKINLIFKNLLTQARKMKNILIKLTLLCALFFSVQVSANKIEKINFTGLITVSEEALLEIISLEDLEDFSPTVSDNIVQKLFNTGSFSDISIVNNLTELNIALIENPYIKFFNVSTQTDIGLSSWLSNKQDLLSEEIIDNFVTESELSAGSLFTKSKLKIFINNLWGER
jgi:outer membrane protein assembly factor BamA